MSAEILAITIDGSQVAHDLHIACGKFGESHSVMQLDFSSVTRIDVPAIRELERFASLAQSSGTRVVLQGVNVDVYKVLKLTNIVNQLLTSN